MAYYSTIEEILEDSGIEPDDLDFVDIENGLTAEEQLEAKIVKWLKAAKSYIDTNRKRDFSESGEEIPVCIHDIAKRIVLNMAKQAVMNRDTPIVNMNDYKVQVTNDSIMTQSILDDLEKCAPFDSGGSNACGLNILTIYNKHQMKEDRERCQ